MRSIKARTDLDGNLDRKTSRARKQVTIFGGVAFQRNGRKMLQGPEVHIKWLPRVLNQGWKETIEDVRGR